MLWGGLRLCLLCYMLGWMAMAMVDNQIIIHIYSSVQFLLFTFLSHHLFTHMYIRREAVDNCRLTLGINKALAFY